MAKRSEYNKKAMWANAIRLVGGYEFTPTKLKNSKGRFLSARESMRKTESNRVLMRKAVKAHNMGPRAWRKARR